MILVEDGLSSTVTQKRPPCSRIRGGKEGLIDEPQLHAVPHSSERACDSSKG